MAAMVALAVRVDLGHHLSHSVRQGGDCRPALATEGPEHGGHYGAARVHSRG
jgi:hypothetical protein